MQIQLRAYKTASIALGRILCMNDLDGAMWRVLQDEKLATLFGTLSGDQVHR